MGNGQIVNQSGHFLFYGDDIGTISPKDVFLNFSISIL